ncbi:SprT-like protein [Elsinoe fawcettii]|nr:SprT-like protein [Elsinoe fawcettii]
MARKNIDTQVSTTASTRKSSAQLPASDHSFPSLSVGDAHANNTSRQVSKSPRKVASAMKKQPNFDTEYHLEVAVAKHGTSIKRATARKVRLLPAVNSINALEADQYASFSPSTTPVKSRRVSPVKARATPARSVKKATSYRETKIISIDSSDDDDDIEDVEESVFCDGDPETLEESSSDSEASLDSPVYWPGEKIKALSPAKTALPDLRASKALFPGSAGDLDLRPSGLTRRGDQSSSDSDKENSAGSTVVPGGLSRPLTPPDKTTPPPSPSKSRLASPSKQRFRVPTPPGRPSLDNFWDVNEVNTWNDRHSPKKPVLSPSKHRFLNPSLFNSPSKTRALNSSTYSDDETKEPLTPSRCASPTKTFVPTSPSKSPLKSPQKSRAEVLARKTFDESKEDIARSFIAELDQKICQGQIASATVSTGGIKIVWSKTLNSTAGRASWKRETVRSKHPSPPVITTSSQGSSRSPTATPIPPYSSSTPPLVPDPGSTSIPTDNPNVVKYRHHATIELATKVLTTPDRLYNTLAHEFCHLATYIISGVKDRPHGAEFKAWGKRCDQAFADRGVKVTTKHGYEIEFRYLWVCAGSHSDGNGAGREGGERGGGEEEGVLVYDGGCGREYGRHSKSIDPAKQRCGGCKGRLVQIRPAPRGKKEVGGFAGYVKTHFAGVKKEMEGKGRKVGHGEVMAELGRRYRAAKEGDAKVAKVDEDMDDLVKGMQDVVVISDGE